MAGLPLLNPSRPAARAYNPAALAPLMRMSTIPTRTLLLGVRGSLGGAEARYGAKISDVCWLGLGLITRKLECLRGPLGLEPWLGLSNHMVSRYIFIHKPHRPQPAPEPSPSACPTNASSHAELYRLLHTLLMPYLHCLMPSPLQHTPAYLSQ